MSWPSSMTVPLVAVSMAPTMFMSVVLPGAEADGAPTAARGSFEGHVVEGVQVPQTPETPDSPAARPWSADEAGVAVRWLMVTSFA